MSVRLVSRGRTARAARSPPRRRRRRPRRTGRGSRSRVTLVLLGADRLEHVGREHRADLGAPLVAEPAGQADEEAGPERVADAGGVDPLDVAGDRHVDRVLALGADVGAVLAAGDDPGGDPVVDLGLAPSGLGLGEVRLVLVGEEVVGAVDELADERAVGEGELLRGVGDERDAAAAALLGVAQHRLGVVGADEHEVEVPLGVDRAELDHPGLGHRPGVEGGDLGHRVVGGADEARGVPRLRDVHVVGDDAVAGQPAAVVGEVLARGADEDRPRAEHRHPEADVARDTAAADLEGVGEEAHRDLVELLDDEGVREGTPEGHEVVGRDGPGDGDLHDDEPTPRRRCRSAARDAERARAGGGAGPLGWLRQLKLSPQAQELPALGLSMVKPCFSMVSAKSIVAPSR